MTTRKKPILVNAIATCVALAVVGYGVVEIAANSFKTTRGQSSHATGQREVAVYLRNGSLWRGQFTADHGELDFGDDRLDAAHGLGDLLHSETLTTFPSRSGQSK